MRELTPDNIVSLKSNEIFVFGSNEGSSTGGRPTHGKGMAKTAKDLFGAKQGQSRGLQGKSYAVVTKKYWDVKKSSTLKEIGIELKNLMTFAKSNPELKFLVPKIGTENAGYTVDQIRDLFWRLRTIIPDNIILPKEFEFRD